MAYSPHAVFYGHCDDPTQKWSVAFPDGNCEEGKPLLFSLVENQKIKEKAYELLNKGASPEDYYGHELYVCPKCMRFDTQFYFKLTSWREDYEPEYICTECKEEVLIRAGLNSTDNGRLEIVDI